MKRNNFKENMKRFKTKNLNEQTNLFTAGNIYKDGHIQLSEWETIMRALWKPDDFDPMSQETRTYEISITPGSSSNNREIIIKRTSIPKNTPGITKPDIKHKRPDKHSRP